MPPMIPRRHKHHFYIHLLLESPMISCPSEEKKKWNLINALFCDVKWCIEIRFFLRFGTHSVSLRMKVFLGDFRAKDHMCETVKLEPSLSITLLVASYSEWMDRLLRSLMMLWDTAESMSHLLSVTFERIWNSVICIDVKETVMYKLSTYCKLYSK